VTVRRAKLTPPPGPPYVAPVTDHDEVTLRGMRFHALVGVLPHEAQFPQPLEVDVTASVARGSAVLDYRLLYAAAADAVDAGAIGYLETFAADVADRALQLGGVARVQVAVRKPHVALAGPLDFAEVRITRER
jgi:7,8-dihydroneopterin aldolase/epimerase/oxygenase